MITDQQDQVLRLPLEALDADEAVLRYRQGRLERLQPTLGLRNWSWVAVEAGLDDGDRLVQQPGLLHYQPGMAVEIQHE